jgi:hypothetical protein
MSEEDELDVLRDAANVSWAEQVRAAGIEPTTGRDIVLQRLRQSAKQFTESHPELRADTVLGYIEDCLRVAASLKPTDMQGNALAFLQSELISYIAEHSDTESPSLGPEATAFLSKTLFFAYLLGCASVHER